MRRGPPPRARVTFFYFYNLIILRQRNKPQFTGLAGASWGRKARALQSPRPGAPRASPKHPQTEPDTPRPEGKD